MSHQVTFSKLKMFFKSAAASPFLGNCKIRSAKTVNTFVLFSCHSVLNLGQKVCLNQSWAFFADSKHFTQIWCVFRLILDFFCMLFCLRKRICKCYFFSFLQSHLFSSIHCQHAWNINEHNAQVFEKVPGYISSKPSLGVRRAKTSQVTNLFLSLAIIGNFCQSLTIYCKLGQSRPMAGRA